MEEVLTADDFGVVKIFGLDKLPNFGPKLLATNSGKYLALSPDGRMLRHWRRFLQLWTCPPRREIYEGPIEGQLGARFFPRRRYPRHWHGQRRNCPVEHSKAIRTERFPCAQRIRLAITFSPDGQFLASGGWTTRSKSGFSRRPTAGESHPIAARWTRCFFARWKNG